MVPRRRGPSPPAPQVMPFGFQGLRAGTRSPGSRSERLWTESHQKSQLFGIVGPKPRTCWASVQKPLVRRPGVLPGSTEALALFSEFRTRGRRRLLKPGGPGLSDSALGGEGRVAGGWKELLSAGGVERLAGVAPEIMPLLGGSESKADRREGLGADNPVRAPWSPQASPRPRRAHWGPPDPPHEISVSPSGSRQLLLALLFHLAF